MTQVVSRCRFARLLDDGASIDNAVPQAVIVDMKVRLVLGDDDRTDDRSE